MRPNKTATALMLVLMLSGAAGCIYRMPILQGNFLNPDQIEQLQEGMTRSQVSFLLGTPMVPTAFNSERWDYLYYADKRRFDKPETRRLTVYFQDDKVARFEREE